VGGLVVLGLISLVDKIVAPETFIGRIVSTVLMAVGLLIASQTWGLLLLSLRMRLDAKLIARSECPTLL
jgi:hypothetical protein